MELGQIDYSEASEDGIAGYGEFRQAAAAARTEDFPQLLTLKDGGLFALRLDAIVPPALRPMDEVRDAVAAGWTAEETHRRLAARAAELQAGLANGAKLNTSGLVVTRYTDFARNGHLADAPGEIVSRAFALDLGQSAVIDTSGRVFLVQTDAIHAASPDSAESKRIAAAVKAQLDQSLGSDMFQFYVQSVENEAGISLNAAAINAVHAQMN